MNHAKTAIVATMLVIAGTLGYAVLSSQPEAKLLPDVSHETRPAALELEHTWPKVKAEPVTVILPRMTVRAMTPAPIERKAVFHNCRLQTLEQGGSPFAPFVAACEVTAR